VQPATPAASGASVALRSVSSSSIRRCWVSASPTRNPGQTAHHHPRTLRPVRPHYGACQRFLRQLVSRPIDCRANFTDHGVYPCCCKASRNLSANGCNGPDTRTRVNVTTTTSSAGAVTPARRASTRVRDYAEFRSGPSPTRPGQTPPPPHQPRIITTRSTSRRPPRTRIRCMHAACGVSEVGPWCGPAGSSGRGFVFVDQASKGLIGVGRAHAACWARRGLAVAGGGARPDGDGVGCRGRCTVPAPLAGVAR
jgi:hypothetical protein